jgi:hypothetical protein
VKKHFLLIATTLLAASCSNMNNAGWIVPEGYTKFDSEIAYRLFQSGEVQHNCEDIPQCVRLDIVSKDGCDMLEARVDFFNRDGDSLGDGVKYLSARIQSGENATLSIYPFESSRFASAKINNISCTNL